MRQAYAGSKYRVRHVQSAVHDAHLPFTGMQLKVFVREPSEDVPQCRDTYPGKNGKRYEVIPIHAPAWGATAARPLAAGLDDVSIHAPAWGATGGQPVGRRGHEVSIHAPAWGATLAYHSYFCGAAVSIHAPAWGATFVDKSDEAHLVVSIHAPAWGAT